MPIRAIGAVLAVLTSMAGCEAARVITASSTLGQPGHPERQHALRRGVTDDASDALPFPGTWDEVDTWRFDAGTPLSVGFELSNAAGAPMAYALAVRWRRRDTPDAPLWQLRHDRQPYARPVTLSLPPLPLNIDAYLLDLELETFVQDAGQWRPSATLTRHLTIYATLAGEPDGAAEPRMGTWVRVLDTAVRWAHGADTAAGAALALTEALHARGSYHAGHSFTRDFGVGESWQQRFYLRDFLEDPRFPRGQCDDFSDFLQVLVASVGVPSAWVHRSGPHLGPGFRTHPVEMAGSPGLAARQFAYHQYVQVDDHVYDAAIDFEPHQPTARMAPGAYAGALVDAMVMRSGVVGVWEPSLRFRPVSSADAQPP